MGYEGSGRTNRSRYVRCGGIEEEEVTAEEDIPESQEQEKAVIEPYNFRIQDNDLGAGGPKAKYKANMEAIHLLQTLEKEERLAAPEEQEILSRYVGWGGIPQAFEESNSSWQMSIWN